MKLRVPVAVALALIASMPGQAAVRVTSGLVAIYDFAGDQGRSVKDRSGVEPLINLRIKDTKSTRRRKGSLEVIGETGLQSEQTAGKLYSAIQKTDAITIEAWVKPANTTQEGPARMVTLSRNMSLRNFTMGQEKNQFVVRFRTTKTSVNGEPSISTLAGSVKAAVTHVLYTRARNGRARIYLNGKRVVEKTIAGSVSNWVSNYRLGLGNELNGNRKWEGTYYLVAFYNRALSAAEVTQNFQAGANALVNPAAQAIDVNAELFETKIAPLIAKHCLECHNPATRKGKLDLTRQVTAFAGGENIVPGKSAESALWEAVAENEMPKKRPPLSADEKAVLKKWIDGGAKWTLGQIDPAVYAHDGQSHQNWIRRLTIDEYIATVRAATGVDIAADTRALLPPDVGQFMLIVAGPTMLVTPLVASAAGKLAMRMERDSTSRRHEGELESEGDMSGHVILAGFGRVGQTLATTLEAEAVPYLALDADAANVAAARAAGLPVFYGDAARLEMLNRAHIDRAQAVVVTMDAPVAAEKIVREIRQAWPDIPVYVRARDGAHAARLNAAGATMAVPETIEASLQLAGRVLSGLGASDEVVQRRLAHQRIMEETLEQA